MRELLKKMVWLFCPWYFKKTSFSEEGEDLILNSFLNKKTNGFYVDVGANHPYRSSNTALFYRKGWRGINIEPTPSVFKLLKFYRKRDINVNVGISNQECSLMFHSFNWPGYNTFDEALACIRLNENSKLRLLNKSVIPVCRLSSVLDQHLPKGQKIDFLSIDVEGLDLDVLRSNDWSVYIPTFILVENNEEFNLESIHSDKIHTFLCSELVSTYGWGYKLVGRTKNTSLYQILAIQ